MVHRMIGQGTSKLRQLLVTLFYHQKRGHPGFSISLFPVLPLTAATFLYHLTKLASEAEEQPSVRPVVCSKSVGCVA
jgi:transketolase N-terminal domain/subunit